MTGLGVCTVSDEESPLHRAIVKLTQTTRQSAARVWLSPQAAGSGFPPPLVPRRCWRASLLAHVPRGRRRQTHAEQTLIGGCWLLAAGCICNLTADPGLGTSQRNAASGAASGGLGASGVGRRGFWIVDTVVRHGHGVLYCTRSRTLEHMSKRTPQLPTSCKWG
jgi:hypothetical protein